MFTGIVQALGRIVAVDPTAGGASLRVDPDGWGADAGIGDSIAVNGVCLTLAERDAGDLRFDAVPETINRTNLGLLKPGDLVNLERPLRLGAALDGHLVQGHVDGTGEVVEVRPEGTGRRIRIRLPAGLERFVIEKGSITVDGISLTVAAIEGAEFEVAIIPHTWEVTALRDRPAGARVNIEIDMMARYIERLLTPYAPAAGKT